MAPDSIIAALRADIAHVVTENRSGEMRSINSNLSDFLIF